MLNPVSPTRQSLKLGVNWESPGRYIHLCFLPSTLMILLSTFNSLIHLEFSFAIWRDVGNKSFVGFKNLLNCVIIHTENHSKQMHSLMNYYKQSCDYPQVKKKIYLEGCIKKDLYWIQNRTEED